MIFAKFAFVCCDKTEKFQLLPSKLQVVQSGETVVRMDRIDG